MLICICCWFYFFSGFRGKTCDVNVDDCAVADCGAGKCVDLIANHSCNCTGTGFMGKS